MKVAINSCYGGFGLSKEAYKFLKLEWDGYGYDYCDKKKRNAPELIKCIETLGKKASGCFAELKIVEIPDDIEYIIEEYDGVEWIAEKHRTWK